MVKLCVGVPPTQCLYINEAELYDDSHRVQQTKGAFSTSNPQFDFCQYFVRLDPRGFDKLALFVE